MLDYIEIFSLVTGVVFIIMQIIQHKWMWYLQLATAISAIIVASFNHLWGSAALNLFFTVMAFLGIYRWKKMEEKMEEKSEPDRIHIARLSRKALPISFSIIFFGGSLMYFILTRPGVNDPYPFLDSITFVLSMVGSYWLTRSYIWQWLVWFIADSFGVVLYFSQGLNGMGILYCVYLLSCIIGYINWKKNGVYV